MKHIEIFWDVMESIGFNFTEKLFVITTNSEAIVELLERVFSANVSCGIIDQKSHEFIYNVYIHDSMNMEEKENIVTAIYDSSPQLFEEIAATIYH